MNLKKIKNNIIKPFTEVGGLKIALRLMFSVILIVFLIYEFWLFKNRGMHDLLFAMGISLLVIVGGFFMISHIYDGIKKLPSSIVFYLGASITMLTLLFTSYRAEIGNYIAIGSCIVFLFSVGIEGYRIYFKMRFKQKYFKTIWLRLGHTLLLLISFMMIVYIFYTEGLEGKLYENAFETYQTDLELDEIPERYNIIKGVYGSEKYLEKYPSASQEISRDASISYFLGKWNESRETYLDFNVYDVPLNAQYFMPEEKGVYPLVLLIHGNHEMVHDSEIGYDYLGSYLAKRGYIVVSVDENFLNYSTYNSEIMDSSLGGENDARAYTLLEHVGFLTSQNKNDLSIFYEQIDLDNIALMGHSRGGEAVALAKFFNDIDRLPNDYRKRLGQDYGIKSIVAIAPTDRQYKPGSRPVELTNVNYLLLHGSHDMDVSYLAGSNMYERITFTDDDYFKSQVWIYGANHGYFNETWHEGDTSPIAGKLHNIGQLIDRKDQEAIASQLISYFLETTLKNDQNYEKGFVNLKAFKDLKENLYLSQYHNSSDEVIVDYSEDNILRTGTKAGVYITTSGLSKMYEGTSRLDGKNSMIYGTYIGWEGHSSSDYTLDISATDVHVDENDAIVLTLADDTKNGKNLIDLNVELEDALGRVVSLPLSHYGLLQHSIEINLTKFYALEDINKRESFFQSFELPVDAFNGTDDFDITSLSKIRLSFPKGQPQVILMKDLVIRHQD